MRRADPAGQRGVAVLMALFVAVLATVLVSGLFWQQFVLLRTIENQQLVAQSRILLAGALDWARSMLRDDQGRSGHDSLDEFWAQGLAETRLDQLGETSTLAAQASIAGHIEDAQSRMNLRNLIDGNGKPDKLQVEAFERLCKLLAVPPVAATVLAVKMSEVWPPQDGDVPAANPTAPAVAPTRPLPPLLPADLAAVRGISAEAAAKLAPYVVLLDAPTVVNANTAGAEVIAAQLNVPLELARAFVAERERLSHFRDVANVSHWFSGRGIEVGANRFDVASRYFFVRGQVKLARADIRMEALVRRSARAGEAVEVLWRREL